ncbi:hypothetical protein [Clostridium sp.]
MNYTCSDAREQIRVESLEDYVEIDSEVRIIDKIKSHSLKMLARDKS